MISFDVIGEPGAQGSKSHDRHGRMFESSKKVAPWRSAVSWAAVPAVNKHGKITGPVVLCIQFVMKRPKKHAKHPNARPAVTPDLDKVIRSSCDSLTQSGAWEDDSRVVELICSKRYQGDPWLGDKWAHRTGAWICVLSLEEWEKKAMDTGFQLMKAAA